MDGVRNKASLLLHKYVFGIFYLYLRKFSMQVSIFNTISAHYDQYSIINVVCGEHL